MIEWSYMLFMLACICINWYSYLTRIVGEKASTVSIVEEEIMPDPTNYNVQMSILLNFSERVILLLRVRECPGMFTFL
jgi:hypothetical protein